MGGAAPGSMDRLSAAIDDFLLHLRVERGLSPATLSAYRADLLDFAASRGASAAWDNTAEVPIRYLSMLGCCPALCDAQATYCQVTWSASPKSAGERLPAGRRMGNPGDSAGDSDPRSPLFEANW